MSWTVRLRRQCVFRWGVCAPSLTTPFRWWPWPGRVRDLLVTPSIVLPKKMVRKCSWLSNYSFNVGLIFINPQSQLEVPIFVWNIPTLNYERISFWSFFVNCNENRLIFTHSTRSSSWSEGSGGSAWHCHRLMAASRHHQWSPAVLPSHRQW